MAVSLQSFFRPLSVAIVGAGERRTSSGGAVLRNLQLSQFAGSIIPVHPKGGELLGLPVCISLKELTPPADLVVIVVRPDLIVDIVREAALTGHRHFLILPGGFAEAGPEGKARDAELRALAGIYDLLIAGPNSAGIVNLLAPEHSFAATFLRELPRGGGVALISQSGAIAEEVVASSHSLHIALGAVVSMGNAMQLHVEDYLEYFAADPDCKCILLYLESIRDSDRFRRISQAIAPHKPIVMLFGGTTAPGAAAAKAHTGAVACTDSEIDCLCDSSRVLRVRSLRELLLAGKGLGRYSGGIGRSTLVLSNSGGPGVLTADRAARAGLYLAPLPPRLEQRLATFLPPEASIANPLDLLADAREDRFAATLEAALQEAPGSYDSIMMIHAVPFMVEAGPVIERLAALAHGADIALLHCMIGTLPERQAWFATMEAAGVPTFSDVEDMASTAAMLADYRYRLRGDK